MKWDYSKRSNYQRTTRDYRGGYCNFIYAIFKTKVRYTAEARVSTFRAKSVAVRNKKCTKESIFKDHKKLIKAIVESKVFCLYIGFCNCVGKITREEY